MGYSRAFRYACAFAGIAGLVSPANAELTKTDKIVGDWHIYSETDSMTDGLQCAAFFEDGTNVHLSPRGLHISVRGRGGWRNYRYRIGEGRPILGIAPSLYTDSSFVTIKGRDFARAVEARRIRIQINTYLDTVLDEDVDLTSAPAVIATMSEMGCK